MASAGPEQVVREFAELLGASGIPYMVTGSIASSLYGLPRATQDIDIVISTDLESLVRFVDTLPTERFYASRESAERALRSQSMFNVIDLQSGWKVDLICRKTRPFSVAEFERRRMQNLAGEQAYVATAEDVILAKLEWAKQSGSDRQLEDIANILRVQQDLDLSHVEHWVQELELAEPWGRAQSLLG